MTNGDGQGAVHCEPFAVTREISPVLPNYDTKDRLKVLLGKLVLHVQV